LLSPPTVVTPLRTAAVSYATPTLEIPRNEHL
jgi:hypothetical protein